MTTHTKPTRSPLPHMIQHLTFCEGWVNTWSCGDQPLVFDNEQQARDELAQYYRDVREAVRDGDMEDGPDPTSHRIILADESE